MYTRQLGDDLCSDDPRLKWPWTWARCASGYTQHQLKEWTHFQRSMSNVSTQWTCCAIQWGGTTYEARIEYNGDHISSIREVDGEITSRIDAQIAAENLLIDWIIRQYKLIEVT